jgi:MarR-like DNA-binding transcriptional regulator SgrR of sgrS sRNA
MPGGPVRVLIGSALRAEEVHPVTGGGAYIDRIELIDDGGNPALMMRLGEADLALLLGKQIGLAEGDATGRFVLERFEARDRTYFLLMDPGARWINDPSFRRWLAGLIDREQMLDYLFDGRGEAAYSLAPGRSDGPVWERQASRPLAATSEPRISLGFDERDHAAAAIASRLKAALEIEGVRLSLVDRSDGEASMTLLAHMPAAAEVLTQLLADVARMRDHAAGELDLLQRAAEQNKPELRAELVWWAESALMRDGRIVPLLRLEAWLARNPALRDVGSGDGGELLLGDAWWAE